MASSAARRPRQPCNSRFYRLLRRQSHPFSPLSPPPPNSTHSLQPLDVVLFSPLSRNYTTELNRNSQRSQRLTSVTKRDFYSNFWAAWSSTTSPELILKSFSATGVWPMDADAVLKRFNNHPPQQDEDLEIGELGDGDSWRQLRKVFDAAVADKAKIEAKRLAQSIHSLQVNNELLHEREEGLVQALTTKKKRKNKRTILSVSDDDTDAGGAVFLSPRRRRRAREREATKRDEAEQLQLQKTRDRDLKAAATLYKKQQAEEAKAARARAKEERDQAKKQRAEELAARRALKKQQQEAATTQKSHDTGNKTKRKASHKANKNPTKRRRVVGAASGADAGQPPASPPPRISARGRQIKTPVKFK